MAPKLFLLLISPMIMLLSGNISAMYSDPTYLQLPYSIKEKINIPTAPNMTDTKGLRQGQWKVLKDRAWYDTQDTNQAMFYRIISYKDGKPDGFVKDYFITGADYYIRNVSTELKKKYPGFYYWGAFVMVGE